MNYFIIPFGLINCFYTTGDINEISWITLIVYILSVFLTPIFRTPYGEVEREYGGFIGNIIGLISVGGVIAIPATLYMFFFEVSFSDFFSDLGGFFTILLYIAIAGAVLGGVIFLISNADNKKEENIKMDSKESLKIGFQGIELASEGKYQQARTLLERSIKGFEDNYLAYTALAGVYKQLGEYEKGIDILKKLESLPNYTEKDATFYLNMVSLYEAKGGTENTIKYLKEGIKFLENSVDVEKMKEMQKYMNISDSEIAQQQVFSEGVLKSLQDKLEKLTQ